MKLFSNIGCSVRLEKYTPMIKSQQKNLFINVFYRCIMNSWMTLILRNGNEDTVDNCDGVITQPFKYEKNYEE